MENGKNAFRFPSLAVWSWTVNPFYSQLTLVSPCVVVITRVKRSLSIVNFERRIASMPGTPAGQPFAAPCLLSCEQRSLPCHVGCMHYLIVTRATKLSALTSSATLTPFLDGASSMAASARKSFIFEGSRSKAQVCRKPCFRCYLGLCPSAC